MKTILFFLLLTLSSWAQSLVSAAHTGQLDIVRRLLEQGADPNAAFQGATPLLAACDESPAATRRP